MRMNPTVLAVPDDSCEFDGKAKGSWISKLSNEVVGMINALKRHAKWAYYTYEEYPNKDTLLCSFLELLRRTNELTSATELTPSEALNPFLQVIHGDEVPASVTIASLQSIKGLLQDEAFSSLQFSHEFFQYLVVFLTSCQFETSDQTVAELVILEILHIFKLILSHPTYSRFITDSMVCGICQVVFSICVHPKIGDLLKKIAEQETVEILKVIFSKLGQLTKDDEHNGVDEQELKIAKKHVFDFEELKSSLEPTAVPQHTKTSFGFPCIREILAYLGDSLEEVATASSGPRALSDKNRLFSTMLLKTIFTNSAHLFLPFRSCVSVVQRSIFKRLIGIVIESENPALLFNSVSILTSAFLSAYKSLAVSLEIYIQCIVKRLSNSIGKVRFAETNEILLWSLYLLMKDELIPMFIFQRFDCSKGRPFLFDIILKFLTASYSENVQLNYLNFLILDVLVVILKNFWTLSGGSENNLDFLRNEQFHIGLGNELQNTFSIKRQLQDCAFKFNNKAVDGINSLKDLEFITSTQDHVRIAKFLFEETALEGAKVGLYLSKSQEFNKTVLLDFMQMFDFEGKSIDQGLRLILSHFRLPGEAQQIWNIIDAFATMFIQHDKEKIFKSKDAVFVLAYSIIMLNTDLHNTKVKNKMRLDEFIRNNLSVNDGDNFTEEYLTQIYNNIKDDEIIFPEEQNLLQQFQYMWQRKMADSADYQESELVSLSLDPKLVHVVVLIYLSDFINASFSLLKNTKSIEIFNECRELFFLLFSFCKHFKDYSSFENVLGRLIEHVNNSGFDIKDTKFVEILRFLIFIINQNITLLHIQGWVFLFDLVEKLFVNNLIPKNYLISTDYKQGRRVLENIPATMKKQSQSNIRIISALTSILTGSSTSLPTGVSNAKLPENWSEFVTLLERDGMLFDFLQKSTEISLDRLLQVLDYLANEKFGEASSILFVEIYINICLKNHNRIEQIYEKFKEAVINLYANERSTVEVREHVLIGIMRLIEHLIIHDCCVENIMINCFEYLQQALFSPESFVLYSQQIAYGLLAICKQFISKHVTSEKLWISFYEILKITIPTKSKFASFDNLEKEHLESIQSVLIECISIIVEYRDCLYFDKLFDIVSSLCDPLLTEQLANSLFQSLFTLFNRTLSDQDLAQNFHILHLFSKAVLIQSCKSVAITNLQRALLHSDLLEQLKNAPSSHDWVKKIFFEVLFPSMLESTDVEVRQRLIGLSSKTFLQSLSNQLLPTTDGDLFTAVWHRLLEMFHLYHRTSTANESDLVREAVTESIKNLVLVLINLNILSTENQPLWNDTWTKIKQLLPDLYYEYHPTANESLSTNSTDTIVSTTSSRSRVVESEEIYL